MLITVKAMYNATRSSIETALSYAGHSFTLDFFLFKINNIEDKSQHRKVTGMTFNMEKSYMFAVTCNTFMHSFFSSEDHVGSLFI